MFILANNAYKNKLKNPPNLFDIDWSQAVLEYRYILDPYRYN